MKKKILLLALHVNILIFSFGQYPPNTVWHPVEPTEVSQPNYLQTWSDVVHNIDVTCVSNSAEFGYPNGSGELLPPYSKVQAWNSDMTKIAVGFNNILNADDYTYYKSLYGSIPAGGFNDGRWSHTNPNIRFLCNGNKFYKINIETEVLEELETFPVAEARVGPFEGNISADDKYVVVTDALGFKAYLYDIELDYIVSSKTFTNNGFDWASITPWNDYIAVSNNNTGVVELYDLNFVFLRNLSDNQQHADFGIDSNGNEVLVQVSPLSMTRLDNSEVTDLITDAEVCGNFHFDPFIGGHISCRNINFPGWALVSTGVSDECTNGLGYYYITEMFAIKLDGSGTIKHFGHSFSSYVSLASISPDGSKVLFTSNWNLFNTNDNNSLAYISEYNSLLSLNEFSNDDLFTVFPNPSNTSISISFNEELISTIEIYNSIGKKIKNINFNNLDVVDISNLNSGVYILRIKSDKNTYFKSFVKN
jgi:hypothetical protein